MSSSSYSNPTQYEYPLRPIVSLTDTAGVAGITISVLPSQTGSIFSLNLGNGTNASTINLPPVASAVGCVFDFLVNTAPPNSNVVIQAQTACLRGYSILG